ncbi:hypothetical protein M0R45_009983 [Rubus argutus]|uniref:Post-SET domain-containing protein n=1 Tax=Rubus argutus TaxID=59490 RepID=A0AAW1Y914_RUBAR
MRAALPAEIGMAHHVWNSSQAGALVAAVLQGDVARLGKALSSDKIRGRAHCRCGDGQCRNGEGDWRERMVAAFLKDGNLKAAATVNRLDRVGARLVSTIPR